MPHRLLVVFLLLAGCLEREEVITVQPDGAVGMHVTINADSHGELYGGDATPCLERGWLTDLQVEDDGDGGERYSLTAHQAFDPGAPLPSDFANPTDAFRDAVLRFPTTLVIEDRRDGAYYHFRRVYPARAWAQIEGPREVLMKQVEKLAADRKPEQMEPAERVELLRLLARGEVLRFRVFARDAFRDVADDTPQDVWLELDRAIEALPDGLDLETVARLVLEAAEDPRAEQKLQEILDDLEHAAGEAIKSVLTASGRFSGARTTQFMQRYDYHRMRHRITTDLADDKIEIVVRLPGVIVAHNADSASAGEARWSFNGRLVHDREIELMVTSVVRW